MPRISGPAEEALEALRIQIASEDQLACIKEELTAKTEALSTIHVRTVASNAELAAVNKQLEDGKAALGAMLKRKSEIMLSTKKAETDLLALELKKAEAEAEIKRGLGTMAARAEAARIKSDALHELTTRIVTAATASRVYGPITKEGYNDKVLVEQLRTVGHIFIPAPSFTSPEARQTVTTAIAEYVATLPDKVTASTGLGFKQGLIGAFCIPQLLIAPVDCPLLIVP